MHGTLFTRLPTEIKSIIFVHSLPPIKSVLDIKSPSKSEAPLNISHVCKQWRDISISTPTLWTRICLHLRARQSNSNWALTGVRTFIERSGNCGLFIRADAVFCTKFNMRSWNEWISGMDDLIAVRCRWEQVLIRACPTIWACGFIEGRNWCINQLQRARYFEFTYTSILYADMESEDDIISSLEGRFKIDISDATNLELFECRDETDYVKFLCINKGAHLPKSSRLSIRAYHCDGLSLQTPSINDFLKIAPLEELVLSLPITRGDQRPKSVVRISTLRKLVLDVNTDRITHQTVEQTRDFLHHVEFPSLHMLELSYISNTEEIDGVLSSITSMLHRSNAKIKVLQITNSDSSQVDHVCRFLESLPTVHNLVIGGDIIYSRTLFNQLTANTDRSVLLPLLQTFRYLQPTLILNIPVPSEFESFLLSRSPPDGEDYPPISDETKTESKDTVMPLSRSGTSILRKVITDRRVPYWPSCWEVKRLIKKSTIVTDLHRRGLVFEELRK